MPWCPLCPPRGFHSRECGTARCHSARHRVWHLQCVTSALQQVSPRCDRPPADREDSRTTLVTGLISAENAGGAPRNPVRSRVAMGTGGNGLELGRVQALPGWSCLAWALLAQLPIPQGTWPQACCHRVSATEGHSRSGDITAPVPLVLPLLSPAGGVPVPCRQICSSRVFPAAWAVPPMARALSCSVSPSSSGRSHHRCSLSRGERWVPA